MKFVIGLVISFAVGVSCRYFDIPVWQPGCDSWRPPGPRHDDRILVDRYDSQSPQQAGRQWSSLRWAHGSVLRGRCIQR
jgi:hypothetical protein